MPLPSRQQTFAYKSCRDLLEKLRREVVRYRLIAGRDDANVEELKDVAFNASVTAWHLSDWVFNDLTEEQRKRFGFKDIQDLQEHARKSCRALHLCRYAATASKHAPWYIVSADNKWFTRLFVASAIVEAVASLDLAYPKIDAAKKKELAAARVALAGER